MTLAFLLSISVHAKISEGEFTQQVKVIQVPSWVKSTQVDNYLLVKELFPASMIPIIRCESSFEQFWPNGTPKVSKTSDVGVMQINRVHWQEAKNRGLDIFNSAEDNIKMGKILYDEAGGVSPWVCSTMV